MEAGTVAAHAMMAATTAPMMPTAPRPAALAMAPLLLLLPPVFDGLAPDEVLLPLPDLRSVSRR